LQDGDDRTDEVSAGGQAAGDQVEQGRREGLGRLQRREGALPGQPPRQGQAPRTRPPVGPYRGGADHRGLTWPADLRPREKITAGGRMLWQKSPPMVRPPPTPEMGVPPGPFLAGCL